MSHPHTSTDGYYLSETEIRYWLRQLLDNPVYGIVGDPEACRALAHEMGVKGASVLRAKYRNGSWVYPGEQRRMTRVIQQVRAGMIRYERGAFRVISPPEPPIEAGKLTRWRIVAGGRLERIPEPRYEPKMPSLKGLFDRAVFWK